MKTPAAHEKSSEEIKQTEVAVAAEVVARTVVPVADKPAFTPRQHSLGLDHTQYDLPYSLPRGPAI